MCNRVCAGALTAAPEVAGAACGYPPHRARDVLRMDDASKRDKDLALIGRTRVQITEIDNGLEPMPHGERENQSFAKLQACAPTVAETTSR